MIGPQERPLVSLWEDEQLTKEMNSPNKKQKEYKPIPYSPKRNPSKRGPNKTNKNSETVDFEKAFATHAFLKRPRNRWNNKERVAYQNMLSTIYQDHKDSINEQWGKNKRKADY